MALKAETDNIRSDLNVFRIQVTGDLMALKENMVFMLRLILQTHKPAPVNSMSFFHHSLIIINANRSITNCGIYRNDLVV